MYDKSRVIYKETFWLISRHSPFICRKISRRYGGRKVRIHQSWLQLGTCRKL